MFHIRSFLSICPDLVSTWSAQCGKWATIELYKWYWLSLRCIFVQNFVDANKPTGANGVTGRQHMFAPQWAPPSDSMLAHLHEYKFTWQQLMGPPHVGNFHIQVLDTRLNIKCSSPNFLCLWAVAHQWVTVQNWRLNIPDCDLIEGTEEVELMLSICMLIQNLITCPNRRSIN